MDEGKPEHAQPHNPAEESPHADSSLVSKLARVYNSLPPEQRRATSLPDSGDPISNPELEDKFQRLLKQLEVLERHQGRREHNPDPKTIALLEKKIEALQARGDNLSEDDASAKAAPGDKPASILRDRNRCRQCGHRNPSSARFCGMCGQGLAAGPEVPRTSGNGSKPVAALPEPPKLVQLGGTTGSSLGFKMALLGVLLLALGLVVYQQQMGRLPLLRGLISNFQGAWTSPAAAKPAAESAPAPVKQPISVTREPGAVAKTPSPLAKPAKAAPPTVITRNLPEPTPLPSTSLPLQLPLPTVPPAAAESVEPRPVEKAPAAAEATAPEPKPLRISQAVPGAPTYKVNPQYPPAARAARVQGAVVMHAIIGTDGTIQQLQVVSGNPLLVNAAMEAVKKWRYRPYLLDGKPVEGETNITVNFKGE